MSSTVQCQSSAYTHARAQKAAQRGMTPLATSLAAKRKGSCLVLRSKSAILIESVRVTVAQHPKTSDPQCQECGFHAVNMGWDWSAPSTCLTWEPWAESRMHNQNSIHTAMEPSRAVVPVPQWPLVGRLVPHNGSVNFIFWSKNTSAENSQWILIVRLSAVSPQPGGVPQSLEEPEQRSHLMVNLEQNKK